MPSEDNSLLGSGKKGVEVDKREQEVKKKEGI
jgi:hypothetical protein